MNEPIIEFHRVSFGYDAQIVLQDIDLQIFPNDFIGIIGPNGGGKTTLIRLILGFIKPTGGHITVFGQSPEIKQDKAIGYVPQFSMMDRDFPISVKEVVAMGLSRNLSFTPWFSKREWKVVFEMLERLSLSDLANRRFGELSGGQKQRCLMARALVDNPRLLLLDEPTASVDNSMEKDIFELLGQLNQNITILLVSHDVGFISSYINKVVCVNRHLVCHHTEELSHHPDWHDTYPDKTTQISHTCRL